MGDPLLFNASGDITTKEILKRYGDLGQNGGPRHQVEPEIQPNRAKEQRPHAPVLTRVDTDPSQTNAWQNKESSVRHVQDPSMAYGGGYGGNSNNQNTPPQPQWQGQDQGQPSPQHNGPPEGHERREQRNSGWGRPPNGSVGVTGT